MLPIYVDIDDVLCHTAQALITLLSQEFKKEVAYENVTSFDLKVSFGLTQSEYEHFMHLAHLPDQILNMDPVPEALETLRGWADSGHEIHIVTGRPVSTHDTTIEWLLAHHVPYDKFIMVNKYGRPEADHATAISLKTLSRMKFHAAIEDSYDMARLIADKMATPVFLVDRPWNRGPGLNGCVKRIQAWEEIQNIDSSLKKMENIQESRARRVK